MLINRQTHTNYSLQARPNVNSRENSEIPKFYSYETPLMVLKMLGFGLCASQVGCQDVLFSSLFQSGVSVFLGAQFLHLGCDLLRQYRINNLLPGEFVQFDGQLCFEMNGRLIRIETIIREYL